MPLIVHLALLIRLALPGDTVASLGKDIDCIYQDVNEHYWFGSNGNGVYRYDGATIIHYTERHGLVSNYVLSIQKDVHGHLWFGTRDGYCRFDGSTFQNLTNKITNAPYGTITYKPGGLFFPHMNGVCWYDGTSFTNVAIHPIWYQPKPHTRYREYFVYCSFVDRAGNIWFGTQEKGVCVYNGRTFTYINGHDLGGPAVRAIYQDHLGAMWFGNNGGGLFRYAGGQLRNLTEEQHLGNAEFLRDKMPVDKLGSMARVFAINEDNSGNLWIGTVDAGVWKYDGATFINYTEQHGLSGASVPVIYKDRKGALWFVVNGDSIYHFDGETFTKVDL